MNRAVAGTAGAGRGGRPAAGYTLVELLVVLAILGLITAIALPMFTGVLPGAELKSAARNLGADMRYARSRAIAGNREVTLSVDLVARRYAISGEARERSLPEELTIDVLTARSELEGGDALRPRRASIRFFPDGSSTGGRVSLSRGGRTYHVGVDWLTGRVKVVDGNELERE